MQYTHYAIHYFVSCNYRKIIFFIGAGWVGKKPREWKTKKNLSVQGLIFKLHALRCEILALLKKKEHSPKYINKITNNNIPMMNMKS